MVDLLRSRYSLSTCQWPRIGSLYQDLTMSMNAMLSFTGITERQKKHSKKKNHIIAISV